MQDAFALDISDYGKLGLLRLLTRGELTLAVLWWKTIGTRSNRHERWIGSSRRREGESRER